MPKMRNKKSASEEFDEGIEWLRQELAPRRKTEMPKCHEYNSVLSTFGEVVKMCVENGEGAIILIRPAKKAEDWIIQTSSLCFLQHPDKVVAKELEKLLASPEEWTDWEDTAQ